MQKKKARKGIIPPHDGNNPVTRVGEEVNMKRAIVSLFLFFLLCLLSNHTIDYTMGRQIENRSPYSLAFASIGAISLESRLDCWAKLRTDSTENELKRYMHTLATSLNLEYQPDNVLISSYDGTVEMEYNLAQKGVQFYLAVQSRIDSGETHFIVSVQTRDPDQSLTHIKQQLDRVGILEWHDYYLYKGELKETFDQAGTVSLANVIMRNLGAVAVDSFQEGRSFSCTGYSQDINGDIEPIWVDGKRYNVQVALYSSPSQDKTYVYIGVPLIVGNY
ncbi:MAG TPA: YwmB family TATA-box binding protein [Syntrophomonadaceae bacterium]|nr:YwmB family TATA-box binding protein [Syntrophomonadaceae bacterium]